ncbi:leucyl aminopeptidase [Candidatus Woesearchaeota archaeon]|nr:leucyl aminopeptidase [Candidatus Woesearchaeota archaeon]
MAKLTTSVKAIKTELSKVKDNALLIGFFKGKSSLSPALKKLDKRYGNVISSFIKSHDFKAEKGENQRIFVDKGIKNIILVGLGEEEKYGFDILSTIIADVSKRLRDNKIESFSIFLDSFTNGKFKDEEAVEKMALGSLIGLYQFTEFKTKDKDKIKFVDKVTIMTSSSKNFDKSIGYACIVADTVNKTRDLVNTPPNVATPAYVAEYAKGLAKKSGLKCTTLDEKQIEKMNMGCFIAVSKGSINRPRLLVLEYNGAGKGKKPIAVVGKGITFDSGGLNLKPYPYILNMKDDKGGAVAAIHVIEACSKLKLPLNLVVVAPLAENMIDADSYRPDDVLTAYNGMTVEIKNTDAEGRLVLADALAYTADKFKPEVIIDIATLTGASLVVLGYVGTPFVCTDENMRKKLNNASAKSLEKLWELPLWQEYDDSLKSDIADIKHIGDEGEAGVITAAMFLKNFVNDVPWLHIDIGTTVWSKADKGMLTKGATGATVRLLIEMLREWK